MSRTTGPVPCGNRKIFDKIGNVRIYISTDLIEGISQEEINRRYKAVQDVYGEIESSRAICEARRKTRARKAC